MTSLAPLRRLVPTIAAVALIGAACGSGAGAVEATGAWARPSPMMADAGAAYMVLSSDEAVSVISASAPADVAGRVELHETVAVDSMDEDSMQDMEHEGDDHEGHEDEDKAEGEDHEHEGMADMAMTMQEVTSIEIPAGGEAVLEPGGLHVMLLDLAEPLETGDEFELTFTQDDGEEFSVTVEVRDEAP